VDADDATGRGKGVQLGTVYDDKGQPVVLQLAVQGQVVGDVDQIFVQQRVGDGPAAAAHRAQEFTTQLVFVVQRDQPGDAVAERGQLHLCQGVSCGQGGPQQGSQGGAGDAAAQWPG